ncbi:hypothetical protein FAZ78_07540 [Cereibacter changlensis]|uniref:Acyl carrier protein n=2 Tax=Cereibacter changlensis TaxID=402884 RepID=A0A2T4JZX5_9RHOB|nr:hypothetical protein [Cereibacter changlensis]PTE23460.1 hypothetical protein C5F48_01735 [Cereibacter changlensis JA139]PZX52964.1 hypothetical protein LX76_02595 [Cereibacter changlensis]TKA97168.1 hypothetical protein FAZ78_07540 [Cereibacter changlensis]
MTVSPDRMLASLQNAVAELNLSLPPDRQISDDPDAVLYGEGSPLDSLGLVNFVMTAEQHIGDDTGADIVLASESAMSRKRSPYRSLRSLADYATEIAGQSSAA